ncbi:hypothetical protein [Helicobacter bizzozeronii]|uniref:hypothetical protein n=1 Tax=Helicobacter bizzozeronii TaxID=56877 RepID=UPI000CED8E89|nr:hypothetical protein [Helicobacter bizzozeronii]
MIRLLLLTLLLLNLQAKDNAPTIFVQIDNPKESLSTPTPAFIQLLTTLQKILQTAKQKTLDSLPFPNKEDIPYDTYLSALQLHWDQDKIWKLARAGMDQVPLFETFNPINAYEQDFLEHAKTFEAMHLISLLNDDPPSQIAQNFLGFLNFFYKPLFEAKKGGLEIDAYLRYLKKSLASQRPLDAYHVLGNYGSSMEYYASFNPEGISKDLIADVGYLYKSYGDSLSVFNDWLKVLIASMLNQDAGYMQKHQLFPQNLTDNPQFSPLKDMPNLYMMRVLQVIKDIDAYVDLQDITPQILQQRPTICLNLNYLNPALQQECQTLLSQPHPEFKAQLELLGILIMDNKPCVSLDANQQPLFFHTKDAFCQALQTNLKKEF